MHLKEGLEAMKVSGRLSLFNVSLYGSLFGVWETPVGSCHIVIAISKWMVRPYKTLRRVIQCSR